MVIADVSSYLWVVVFTSAKLSTSLVKSRKPEFTFLQHITVNYKVKLFISKNVQGPLRLFCSTDDNMMPSLVKAYSFSVFHKFWGF